MSRPHTAQPSARVVLEAVVFTNTVGRVGLTKVQNSNWIAVGSEGNALAMSGIIFWLFRGSWRVTEETRQDTTDC